MWAFSSCGEWGPLFVEEHSARHTGFSNALLGLSSYTQAQLLQGMWNFQDLAYNSYPLHWQAYSYPLNHQGNPDMDHFKVC